MKPLVKSLLVILLFIFINPSQSFSQSSVNYSVSSQTTASLSVDRYGNVINFSGQPNLIANNITNVNGNLQAIGFDIVFMGKYYTHFIAGNDGQLALGLSGSPAGMLAGTFNNDLTRPVIYPPTFTNNGPVLAAFWDDLRTSRVGNTVQSVVTGVAPNRCLVIQWNVVIGTGSSTSTNPADGIFQARIYEGSGEIEYVYGKMTIGPGSSTITASIGFTAGNTDNSFIAVQDLSGFATTRLAADEPATQSLVNTSVSGNIGGLHSTTEGSRRRINFLPVACNGDFTNSSVSRVFARTMELTWADNISNKVGYLLYRSVSDSGNYQLVATLSSSATNYIATELNTNTRYYWKLVPYTEGNTRINRVFTDSTRCSMSGSYSIGPGGQFSSIRDAQDTLALRGINGINYWELVPGFSFTAEPLPVTFHALPPCHETNNTIVIRPAPGANISYLHGANTPVVLLDSTANLILDGRAGGTGAIALSMEGPGALVTIRNGWGNILRYLDLKSSSTTLGEGAVNIQGTLGGGSHHNTIANCSLHDRGGAFTLPQRLLTGKMSENIVNDANIISNNNFYNFRGYALDIEGKGWHITGNSFFSTVPIPGMDTSGFINVRTNDNTQFFQVTGNYFGGNDAQCGGGVMRWDLPVYFRGIYMRSNANIFNNQFKKLDLRSQVSSGSQLSYLSLVMTGVEGISFTVLTDTVRANIFGGAADGDSIFISAQSGSQLTASIIENIAVGTGVINDNSILNLGTSGPGTPDFRLYIISSTNGSAVIRNNTIGTMQHAYRVRHRGALLTAINTYGRASITGNTIANTVSFQKNSGIVCQANHFGDIVSNDIRHVKTMEAPAGFDYYGAAGIATFASVPVSILQNKILHIEDSSMNNTSGASGIFCKESNAQISRNLIDGLVQSMQASNAKTMVGIEMDDGQSTIDNNIIRLGLDSAGNTIGKGLFIGYSSNLYTSNSFIHNSIYLAGTQVVPEGNSGSYGSFLEGTNIFRNNILVNKRTYVGGNGSGIFLSIHPNTAHLIDHNVYYHPDSATFSISYPSFAQWQASGRDNNGVLHEPNFVFPDGPTRTMDLHVSGATVAERRGTAANTTTFDFDGQTRSLLTPVDAGADAGNYTRVDLDPPNIYVSPLTDATDTSSRYIDITITDSVSGVRLSPAGRPTIWYRKSYPSVTAWQYAHGDLVAGNEITGTWRFLINHQVISVSATGGDTIQYYFVAEDTASNLRISPSAGGQHNSVTQQVSAPGQPYFYRIHLSGYIVPAIVLVGNDQRYNSLTRDGGAFEGLKRDSVTAGSTIVLRVVSHLSENGKWGLDSFLTRRNIRVMIEPGYDSMFVISNNSNLVTDMIRLNNFDNLVIDGSYNGSGRWLRFVNSHSNPDSTKATIALMRGADSARIRNAEWENNTRNFPHQGIIRISDGICRNPQFSNNLFTNITGNASKPSIGICGHFTSTPVNLVVSGNHFVNLNNAGIYINSLSDSTRVDSNHFYWNDPEVHKGTVYYAIGIASGLSGHNVNYNFIGGAAPFCGGNTWVNDTIVTDFYGVRAHSGGSPKLTTIRNNMIRNIRTTHPGSSRFGPISGFGTVLIQHNIIGDSTNNQSLVTAGGSNTMIASSGGKGTISDNLIAGIHCTNPGIFASTYGIWTTADSAQVISRNIVRNITVSNATTGNAAATFAGIYLLTRVHTDLVEENEIYNITSVDPAAVRISGIQAASAQNAGGTIRRNRIYNYSMPNSNGGLIAGIYLFQNGPWKVENNQITLNNGNNTNPLDIFGFYDNSTYSTVNDKSVAFNTVFIGGSQSGGTTSSYGFFNEGIGKTVRFKNNLVMNTRTGGSGKHGAIAVKVANPSSVWLPSTSDYNLFVTRDTSAGFLWGTGTMLSMSGWRSTAFSDTNGYITPAQVLPPLQLFSDAAHGNLNINIQDSLCWYVNGKGLPLSDIDADYNQPGIRSVAVSQGPVDIGSHEFSTTVAPPSLYVYGRHIPGGSDTLSFNGRVVGVIDWGTQGTIPDLGAARLYTGTWPNDLTNGNTIANARSLSSYLDLPATGGNGYSYNLTLFYDSSMLGRITDEGTIVFNKKQSNVTGSWTVLHPNLHHTTQKAVAILGQTSFSEFTLTDSLANFVTGVPSPDISVVYREVNPSTIPTGTLYTARLVETNAGSAVALAHQVHYYLSADTILTPGTNGDTLVGTLEMTSNLAVGASSDTASKTLMMPCNIAPGTYYLFFVADGNNQVAEPNENNNTARAAITVVTGLAMPSTPVIAATPAPTVCAPGTVMLNANVSNCSTCSYTWSNGATGASISIGVSGNYMVTATNACGANTSSQVITISPQTPTPVITQLGNTLTSSSGTGNQWYLNSVAIQGATGNTYTPVNSGLYTVIANTNGCPSTVSAPFNFIVTGIVSPGLDAKLFVGPNPVNGQLHIRYTGTGGLFSIVLIDLTGRTVAQERSFTREVTLEMGHLPAGPYIIKVFNTRTKEKVQRIIVKNQ